MARDAVGEQHCMHTMQGGGAGAAQYCAHVVSMQVAPWRPTFVHVVSMQVAPWRPTFVAPRKISMRVRRIRVHRRIAVPKRTGATPRRIEHDAMRCHSIGKDVCHAGCVPCRVCALAQETRCVLCRVYAVQCVCYAGCVLCRGGCHAVSVPCRGLHSLLTPSRCRK